ncbi:MAG: TetR/AcrR family transcriptional regulator, partial [Dehalococcoidia bacterium]
MSKVTQAHIDARREAIRDAAVRLFVQKGVEGARMEEIAAAAGLSAGAIYRYFPSKEHLLLATLNFCIEQNIALFDTDGLETASPLAVLNLTARQVWDRLGTSAERDMTMLRLESALVAARYGGTFAAERHEMLVQIVSFIESLLREAQQTGEIDSAVDAHNLATTLVGAWIGLDLLALDFDEEIDR